MDKMLSAEFQRYATADLNRPLGGETTVLDGVSTYVVFQNIYLVRSKQTVVHLFPVRSFVHPERTGQTGFHHFWLTAAKTFSICGYVQRGSCDNNPGCDKTKSYRSSSS